MSYPGENEQGFGHDPQDHVADPAGAPPAPAEAPAFAEAGHEAFAASPAAHEGFAAAPAAHEGFAAAPAAAWPEDTIAPDVRGWTPASATPTARPDRLELGEGDRLPWLESPEGEDDYEHVDGRRVTGVVIAGLVALAGIVGVVWWGSHHQTGNAPPADGSTVAAPATPYKVAPAQPGGKTFAGTDDTSFAVSQGKQVQEHLGGADASGVASDAAVAKLPGEAHVAAKAAAAPAGAAAVGDGDAAWSGGVVQIGAFNTQARAGVAWDNVSRGQAVLAGVKHRIVSAVVDGGTVWRLQVLTAAGGSAALCDRLKAAGVACQVKH